METEQAGLVDSATALRILRVKRQTLYAYVSRGMVRTFRIGSGARSLYATEDLEAIAGRSRKKREGPAPGERSLRPGGAAVLRTTISFISEDGPVYRGVAALEMVRTGWHFERCIAHLWNDQNPHAAEAWFDDPVVHSITDTVAARFVAIGHAKVPLRQRLMLTAFDVACATDPPSGDVGAQVVARQVVQILAAALRPPSADARPHPPSRLAGQIGTWCCRKASPETLEAIDAALILSADHELAPATFVARIAASAGADLHACALAALGAFEGHSTLLGCDAFETQLLSSTSPGAYADALSVLIEGRTPLAGYQHAAYSRGDPRGRYLLALARREACGHARAEALLKCVDAVQVRLGLAPSIIAGLVLLSHAVGLPPGAASGLMSTGRSAGWMAHCMEQRQRGYKLRPHAAYTG